MARPKKDATYGTRDISYWPFCDGLWRLQVQGINNSRTILRKHSKLELVGDGWSKDKQPIDIFQGARKDIKKAAAALLKVSL